MVSAEPSARPGTPEMPLGRSASRTILPGAILGGPDGGHAATRLGLPPEIGRSFACTNMIERLLGVVRRVCRNVRHWRDARMAPRWTGAGMPEA